MPQNARLRTALENRANVKAALMQGRLAEDEYDERMAQASASRSVLSWPCSPPTSPSAGWMLRVVGAVAPAAPECRHANPPATPARPRGMAGRRLTELRFPCITRVGRHQDARA